MEEKRMKTKKLFKKNLRKCNLARVIAKHSRTKCCFCIPIKPGVMVISILLLVSNDNKLHYYLLLIIIIIIIIIIMLKVLFNVNYLLPDTRIMARGNNALGD